jgi:hypothetical protein
MVPASAISFRPRASWLASRATVAGVMLRLASNNSVSLALVAGFAR